MDKENIKIAVITDVHGNLPALEAALGAIKNENCDYIYHTGDVIAIGPYSYECLELLLSEPKMKLVMGNHDQWFAYGLPDPLPHWMTKGEIKHQLWVHSCLDESLKERIREFPYVLEEKFFDFKITFLHYGFCHFKKEFKLSIPKPTVKDLDYLFEQLSSDIVLYGHNHSPSDIKGKARYINPGSLGCNKEPNARFVILEFLKDHYEVKFFNIPYERKKIFEEFERKKVPERDFIIKNFFGKKE